jgi:DNA-directed RNA polymerase subunit L
MATVDIIAPAAPMQIGLANALHRSAMDGGPIDAYMTSVPRVRVNVGLTNTSAGIANAIRRAVIQSGGAHCSFVHRVDKDDDGNPCAFDFTLEGKSDATEPTELLGAFGAAIDVLLGKARNLEATMAQLELQSDNEGDELVHKVTVTGEDHTLGNLVKNRLQGARTVHTVDYKMPDSQQPIVVFTWTTLAKAGSTIGSISTIGSTAVHGSTAVAAYAIKGLMPSVGKFGRVMQRRKQMQQT